MKNKGLLFLLIMFCFFVLFGMETVQAKDEAGAKIHSIAVEELEKMIWDTCIEKWDSAEEVLFLSLESFDSTLAGMLYAEIREIPFFFTDLFETREDMERELQRLKAKKLYFVGDDLFAEPEAEEEGGLQVVFLDDQPGADPTWAIAEKIKEFHDFDTVILAKKEDINSIGLMIPFSLRNQIPILLWDGEGFTAPMEEALRNWGIRRAVIIGENELVPNEFVDRVKELGVKEVVRLGGRNRDLVTLRTFLYQKQNEAAASIFVENTEKRQILLAGIWASAEDWPMIVSLPENTPGIIKDYLSEIGCTKIYVIDEHGGSFDEEPEEEAGEDVLPAQEPEPASEEEAENPGLPEKQSLEDEGVLEQTVGSETSEMDIQSIFSMVTPATVYGNITRTTPYYSTYASSRKKLGSLEKGQRVEILRDRAREWYMVRDESGKKEGWIPAGSISIPQDPETVTHRMTEKQVEMYVNAMQFSSSTDYFIWVDINRQVVHVFKGKKGEWKLIRTMDCATGRNDSPTTRGLFRIAERGTFFFDEKKGQGAQYWVRFNGPYLFHSVVVDKNKRVIDPTLGKRASEGCVRLSLENSKWLYDTIPSGTSVFVN